MSASGQGAVFPPPEDLTPDGYGLVALGGDLRESTLLEAYRKGIFPWEGREPIPWYSPDPRLVLAPAAFHCSRSLRKTARGAGFAITFDRAFEAVMEACATTPRGGRVESWITPRMIRAYGRLHRRGVAHSVEVWQGTALVGGLYGLAMGRAFFGESMFA
ncbi:MAG: leucyl/phenylalanyl-tRNA--protein transferase, partial [Myxococcales bacterium]|nr:leucyl/phenylalanyl-tRNA--protein transferase [Myxococcales bacterium]